LRRVAAIRRFVLDASVAVAWCFEDEKTAYTELVLDLLASGEEAVVPALWPVEVADALLVAEKRGRVKLPEVAAFLRRLSGFRITVAHIYTAHAFDRVLPVARVHNLTVYEAVYVDLAAREEAPIATLDNKVRRAAVALGIALVRTQ
jgi:predicted nucleic acid-binding protein